MNYNEIAEAYDKLADALSLTSNASETIVMALELREKAADCRAAHARELDHLEYRAFEYKTRTAYLEFERRNVVARELQARSMARQADYYHALVHVMERLVAKPT